MGSTQTSNRTRATRRRPASSPDSANVRRVCCAEKRRVQISVMPSWGRAISSRCRSRDLGRARDWRRAGGGAGALGRARAMAYL
eukprot:3782735-Prymnesium_polylepis.1